MKNQDRETQGKPDRALLERIRTQALSDNWEEREDASGAIKVINDREFLIYLPVWQEWVKSPLARLRRAIEVGLLRIQACYYESAIELLTPLLGDRDAYVRKNCGPFALSAVACRNPEASFRYFEEWIRGGDPVVCWNVAACLGVMFGIKYPRRSMTLLYRLAADERRLVWRAAASSLVKQLRRRPECLGEFLGWEGPERVRITVMKYLAPNSGERLDGSDKV